MTKLLKLLGCSFNPWTGESLYPTEPQSWGQIVQIQELSDDDLLDIMAAEIMKGTNRIGKLH